MMCSLAAADLGRRRVASRQALIGGTFWAGRRTHGAARAVYLRLFPAAPISAAAPSLRILLLAITGLDIVPTLFFLFLYARGMLGFVLPSVEWWNEHLAWFVYTTLVGPPRPRRDDRLLHRLPADLARAAAKGRFGIVKYALPGAMGLASSFGASIWVMFVFGAFLLVWTAIAACKRWFRDVLALVIAGSAAAVLIVPYLRELSGPGLPGPLVALTVRSFFLADVLPAAASVRTWRLILYNGSLLPLNYFLEFGFFLLAARYKWQLRRAAKLPLQREELAFIVMAATSAANLHLPAFHRRQQRSGLAWLPRGPVRPPVVGRRFAGRPPAPAIPTSI